MRKAFKTAAIMSLFLFIGLACASGTEENKPAPDFKLQDIDGNTITLAGLKGKVIVLNFWATTCPPCRREIPGFIETYGSLKDKGLEIIGLSVDDLPVDALKKWTVKAGINYPIAMATREIVEAYQPGEYIPSTIIIDIKGNIRFRHVGYIDKKDLVGLFEKYSVN